MATESKTETAGVAAKSDLQRKLEWAESQAGYWEERARASERDFDQRVSEKVRLARLEGIEATARRVVRWYVLVPLWAVTSICLLAAPPALYLLRWARVDVVWFMLAGLFLGAVLLIYVEE